MKPEINLFKVLDLETPKVANKTKLMLVLLIVASVISVASVILVSIISISMQNNIDRITGILNSPEVKALVIEDEGYKRDIIANEKDSVLLKKLEEYVAKQNSFETQIYQTVNSVKPEGVIIKAINYTGITAVFSCETTAGNNPADFAKSVESTGAFTKVTYKGFTESSDKLTVSFLLECTLPDLSAEKTAEAGTP